MNNEKKAIESADVAVHIEDLYFSRGGNPVIEGLNMQIQAGDYVGLLGQNGSGKTTLLKLILGLLHAQDGSITVYGHKAGDKMTAANIGYVPQHSTGIKEFPATVEEVVRSGRITRRGLFGRFTSADAEAVEEAIEKSGLADLKQRNIAELSGGQRQRVYIARALASRPKLLILDEPTTGVDVSVQHRFFDFLRELNEKEGMTILLVSHDLDTVTHETKTIMCLNKKLVCNLPARDFLGSDHLEALLGADNHGTHTTHEHAHR